jgi:CBS domain-containing protein
MQVAEIMTVCVTICLPTDTIRRAAKAMRQLDVGWLPVGERDRIVGVVTDRDMITRGLAEGLGGRAAVAQVMTAPVHFCREDESVGMAAFYMADLQLRRLPVLNRAGRLVGVLSLGDIGRAGRHAGDAAQQALAGVSRPCMRQSL